MDPRLTLRTFVERWRRSEADAAIALARGDEAALRFPPPHALELLGEHAPALEWGEAEATAAHLARAASERAFAGAREELDALLSERHPVGDRTFAWRACLAGLFDVPEDGASDGAGGRARLDATEAGADDALDELKRARPEADRAAQRVLHALATPPHLDAGPDAAARHADAARWLDATDDARDAALGLLGATDLPSLLTRLCARSLEGLVPAKTLYRRLGARLAPLGFDAVLDRVVRVDRPHREPWPGPKVVVRDVGRDIRLLPSRLATGMLGE
ncbi:MAG: hypothetical protein KF901_28575, partial [Myxococcales bacterium]|nr:hypothetical protein [Myxococcales bacterium]